MRLKTREKDYVFVIKDGEMFVIFDGKREFVREFRIVNGKAVMKTEDNNGNVTEIETSRIRSLNFSVNLETANNVKYKIRSCEKHLLLFGDDEFKGELEYIKFQKVNGKTQIVFKTFGANCLKFHM